MTDDKRTKADLLAELDEANRKIRQAKSDAYDAHQALPNPPSRVEEADALAGCVRALEALKSSKSSGSYGFANSLAYSDGYPRPQGDIERVLRLLAARYSVPLVEVRTEPCHRRHLDEINPNQVMQALGAGQL